MWWGFVFFRMGKWADGREWREIHTGVKIDFGDGFVGGGVNWFSVDVDC